jgi:hypothetical protein
MRQVGGFELANRNGEVFTYLDAEPEPNSSDTAVLIIQTAEVNRVLKSN